jgi:hypothetical protein
MRQHAPGALCLPVHRARILSRSEKQFSSLRRRDESGYSRETADTCAFNLSSAASRSSGYPRLEGGGGRRKEGIWKTMHSCIIVEISSFRRRLPRDQTDIPYSTCACSTCVIIKLSIFFILLTRTLISIAWPFTTHRNDSPRATRREQSLASEHPCSAYNSIGASFKSAHPRH